MALINFDCPECGHNLEVDERGAGFIIKCPECTNPLQIRDLPPARRRRKALLAGLALAAIALLVGANFLLWSRARQATADLADLQQAFQSAVQQSQAAIVEQEGRIKGLADQLAAVKIPDTVALATAAEAALAEAETLARLLEQTESRFLANHAGERTALLRAHMVKLVEASKNGLPAPPSITDAGPGRGVQGRLIVFPILPGPDGQTLRENAEITGVEEDKVFVKFAGGTATYLLSELHPGVAAYLPVDRLLVLPRRQWQGEVLRVHQVQVAERDQRLAALRAAVAEQVPEAVP